MTKKPKLPALSNGAEPISNLDPKNVNGRLYEAISKLLDSFDDMTVREQVATVAAIARIQVLFAKIREEPGAYNSTHSGQTVRKYAKAFETHAARRGKAVTGDTAALLDAPDDSDTELNTNGLSPFDTSMEAIERVAWKQGVLGALNLAALVLSARLLVLVAVLGSILLAMTVLSDPQLFRVVALAVYAALVVLPVVWLSATGRG